jgi:hypothetical protein
LQLLAFWVAVFAGNTAEAAAAIDDQLVQYILEPTEHPQALDAFVSMVLSPAGKLSFDEVLQRVDCPVCLAYGELVSILFRSREHQD